MKTLDNKGLCNNHEIQSVIVQEEGKKGEDKLVFNSQSSPFFHSFSSYVKLLRNLFSKSPAGSGLLIPYPWP